MKEKQYKKNSTTDASFICENTKAYLQSSHLIEFAILFGSFAGNKTHAFSDIDIGIFTNQDLSLPELGALTSRLESRLKRNMDLTVLNNLHKKNPVLAYEIASTGSLIFARDPGLFVMFKTQAFLEFMDTRYLRSMVDRAFQERLRDNRFGESDYVGTSQTSRK